MNTDLNQECVANCENLQTALVTLDNCQSTVDYYEQTLPFDRIDSAGHAVEYLNAILKNYLEQGIVTHDQVLDINVEIQGMPLAVVPDFAYGKSRDITDNDRLSQVERAHLLISSSDPEEQEKGRYILFKMDLVDEERISIDNYKEYAASQLKTPIEIDYDAEAEEEAVMLSWAKNDIALMTGLLEKCQGCEHNGVCPIAIVSEVTE